MDNKHWFTGHVVEIWKMALSHDDVIKWKHFPRYWPFVRGIHRSPVNIPYKGQWLGALMFSLICTRLNGWVNNDEAGDLRRHRAHYDVTVMQNDYEVMIVDGVVVLYITLISRSFTLSIYPFIWVVSVALGQSETWIWWNRLVSFNNKAYHN